MLYVRSGHCMRTQRSCQVTRETPDPDTAWSLRHGACVSLTQHLCDAECGGQTTGVTPGLSSPSRESNTNMDCQNYVSSPDCDYPDCVWQCCDVTSCLCFVLTLLCLAWCCWCWWLHLAPAPVSPDSGQAQLVFGLWVVQQSVILYLVIRSISAPKVSSRVRGNLMT